MRPLPPPPPPPAPQPKLSTEYRGVARIFQRGVTRCQNEVTHQIFMSFLPPVVGCLLKTWPTKGGHGYPRNPPGYAPAVHKALLTFTDFFSFCRFVTLFICQSSSLQYYPMSYSNDAKRSSFWEAFKSI